MKPLMSLISSATLLLLWLGCQVFVADAANDTGAATYFDDDVYASWVQGSNYENSVLLNSASSNSSVGLFWSMDMMTSMIRMAVVCPMGSGWCGFGLAEAGGMKGSDMVIYESQSNDLYDAYVLDDLYGGPIQDECQNWLLVKSTATSSATTTRSGTTGVMIFEAARALDTGDMFDRPFIDDSDRTIPATRIIAAWGNTATVSYHGQNRLTSAVRFYQNNSADNLDLETLFQKTMNESADGIIELTAIDYSIPTNETTYAYFCWTYADLVKMGLPEGADLHAIGLNAIVDNDTKPYVHHFVLYATADPYDTYVTSPVAQDFCADSFIAYEMVYGWAPGAEPVIYPSNVGTPLGTNGYQSFRLETHYNNPSGVPNLTDSSGLRLYWTYKKRQYDLGVLQLGDPNIYLYGYPVGNGTSKHTFVCSEGCSSTSLTQPVTVMTVSLHMHKTGVRQTNEVIRGGEVVKTSAVDFYDFPQQGSFDARQGTFEMQPGDGFRTTCYYTGTDEVWGLGSQQEMCIGYMYYYPRQLINASGYMLPFYCGVGYDYVPHCNATYEGKLLNGTAELNRNFGSSDGLSVCPSTNSSNSNTNSSSSGSSQNSTPQATSSNNTPKSSAVVVSPLSVASGGWHGMVALGIIVAVSF